MGSSIYIYDLTTSLYGSVISPIPGKTTIADLSYILQPSHNHTYMLNGGISSCKNSTITSITSLPFGGLLFNSMNEVERRLYILVSSHNVINKWFSLGTSFEVSDIKSSFSFTSKVDDFTTNKPPYVALSINGNIRLPQKINFNFIYQYNTARQTAQDNVYNTQYLNLVFGRSFLKEKIETFFAINYPFQRINSRQKNVFINVTQYKTTSETDVFRLGLSYTFGKKK